MAAGWAWGVFAAGAGEDGAGMLEIAAMAGGGSSSLVESATAFAAEWARSVLPLITHACTIQPDFSSSNGIVKSPDGRGQFGSVLTSPPSLETVILTMWFGSVVCPVTTPSGVAVLIHIAGAGLGAAARFLAAGLLAAGIGVGFWSACCALIDPHKATNSGNRFMALVRISRLA